MVDRINLTRFFDGCDVFAAKDRRKTLPEILLTKMFISGAFQQLLRSRCEVTEVASRHAETTGNRVRDDAVRVKCACPLRWSNSRLDLRWPEQGNRARTRSIWFSKSFQIPEFRAAAIWFSGLIDMKAKTCATTADTHEYKLICEQCGSLAVVLPTQMQPDPRSLLKCGRCGSPKGTLQSLRERSVEAGSGYPA